MKVIPNFSKLNLGPHILETSEDIVISSQLYDKYTMKIKPFNFFNIGVSNYFANLLQKQVNITGYTGSIVAKDPDTKKWVKDSDDPNIFYCINETGTATSDTIQSVLKIQKIDETWNIVNSIQPVVAYTTAIGYPHAGTNYKILGQTKKYLFVIRQLGGYSSRGYDVYGHIKEPQVIRINKKDMTYTGISYNMPGQKEVGFFPIKITESYMYLYRYVSGNIYISRYNIESNNMTDIYSKGSADLTTIDTTTLNTIGCSNIIEFNNKYYVISVNDSRDKHLFLEFDINFVTDIVTTKTYELESNESVPFVLVPTSTASSGWLHYTLKNINNQYIAVTSHDNENETHFAETGYTENPVTLYSAPGYHRHSVYKFENNTFVFKDTIKAVPSFTHIYGMLYLSPSIVVFLTNFGFSFYEFNFETEKYDKRFDKTGTYFTIGLDEMNRFYALNDSDECEIYTNITACILDVKFELPSYNYDGTSSISTYVIIDVKNFLLQNISVEVKLILSGQCKFANNTKEYVFTTPENSVQIPVTITGGGDVNCYIKQTGVI